MRHLKAPMLRMFFLSLFTAVLALLLAASCFLQMPVHKESTEQSLSIIEKQFIHRPGLSSEQAAHLDRAFANLRWNDQTLKVARSNLWSCGVFGFSVLAALNFLMAIFLNARSRTEANQESGT